MSSGRASLLSSARTTTGLYHPPMVKLEPITDSRDYYWVSGIYVWVELRTTSWSRNLGGFRLQTRFRVSDQHSAVYVLYNACLTYIACSNYQSMLCIHVETKHD